VATTRQQTLDGLGEASDQSPRIKTRERDGVTEERCPSCNGWYRGLTGHWSRGSCPHPEISDETMELLKGMMMGDSCINTSSKYPRQQFSLTNLTFLRALQERLGWLVSGLRQQYTCVQSAQNTRNTLGRQTQPEDTRDCYVLQTRSHPQLEQFADWYDDERNKVFPPDLSLTPTGLAMWYVSDGGLDWSHYDTTCSVKFSSVNESDRPEAIRGVLEEYGWTMGQLDEYFRLSAENTEDFFETLGEPVLGFEYKWCWQDRERYNEMKDACERAHHTQTFAEDSINGSVPTPYVPSRHDDEALSPRSPCGRGEQAQVRDSP